jgi:hypothetical protein
LIALHGPVQKLAARRISASAGISEKVDTIRTRSTVGCRGNGQGG